MKMNLQMVTAFVLPFLLLIAAASCVRTPDATAAFDKSVDKLVTEGFPQALETYFCSLGTNPDLGFRWAGTTAERAVGERVAAEMRAMGLANVRLEPVPVDVFEFEKASLTVGGRTMINARAETLLARPAFRGAVQSRRCLVPASGFYEWKRDGKRKVPFYIRLKTTPLFAFAGLYETMRDPLGHERGTFAVITTEPNELVAGLHDRMPAILARDQEESWIRAGAVVSADLARMLVPYPDGEMEAYPVSGKVNDSGSEGPGLIQPLPGLTRRGTSLFPPGT